MSRDTKQVDQQHEPAAEQPSNLDAAPSAATKPNYTVISTKQTRKRRGFETARDMVWSMAAVFGLVLVILAVTYRPDPDPIRVIDYAPVIAEAKAANSWPVLSPATNPDGWRSTSARIELQPGQKVSVFVGWVTKDDAFASLQQTNLQGVDLAKWLRDATDKGVAGESWTDANGRQWKTFTSSRPQTSLVLTTSQATYVVAGSSTVNELESLANSLR